MKFLFLLILIIPAQIFAQTYQHKGIHEIEYKSHLDDSSFVVKSKHKTENAFKNNKLPIKVFGWHPYWAAENEYLYYDYDVLSTIGYFSYNVDVETGSYSSIHGWDKTPIIEYAHSKDVKVVLVITNFGYENNDAILSNPLKQANLIEESVFLVKQYGGDGINIDFENIRAEQRDNLSNFMHQLANEMKAELPESELSICLPAVDWTNAFDLEALSSACDYLIIMGYNYFWGSSSNAGPVAPLENRSYCVKSSIINDLAEGVPNKKLFLGVPWYGYDWPVENEERMSKTTGTGTARIFPAMETLADQYGKTFDTEYKTPWISYYDAQWRQAWYDDSLSLAYKYAMVENYELGGIGIWAISYHDDEGVVWKGISDYFRNTYVTSSADSEILFYPNPCQEHLYIEIPERTSNLISVQVYSLIGELLQRKENFDKKIIHLYLDSNTFPSGIYYLVINNNEESLVKKFIKIGN